jgi:hypothetical protein
MTKAERDQKVQRISAAIERCSQLITEMKPMLEQLEAERRPRPQLTLVRNGDPKIDDDV